MASIYIHIPFCRQACSYCDFYFIVSKKTEQDFFQGLFKEIKLQQDFFSSKTTINSIYFGGGTPSFTSYQYIKKTLENLFYYFNISFNVEITLEANPDDITDINLKNWKKLGINRLSLGVQTFHESSLSYLKRNHSIAQAFKSIEKIQSYLFKSFSIDLIFGIPTLNHKTWEATLKKIIDLNIPHISCYNLTVESNTPLFYQIKKKSKAPVTENHSSQQFVIASKMLQANHYLHYEISNYAKNEKDFSLHNYSYWKRKEYLGLGPSAHSFNGKQRFFNIKNQKRYIESLLKDSKILNKLEIIDKKVAFNEVIMLDLRTWKGCNLLKIEAEFGNEKKDYLLKKVTPFVSNKLVNIKNNHIILSEKGKLFADYISAELFYI